MAWAVLVHTSWSILSPFHRSGVKGKQGIFSTFAAFLEMCVSEITMARLNKSNVLCHFSHSGVDDMCVGG